MSLGIGLGAFQYLSAVRRPFTANSEASDWRKVSDTEDSDPLAARASTLRWSVLRRCWAKTNATISDELNHASINRWRNGSVALWASGTELMVIWRQLKAVDAAAGSRRHAGSCSTSVLRTGEADLATVGGAPSRHHIRGCGRSVGWVGRQ